MELDLADASAGLEFQHVPRTNKLAYIYEFFLATRKTLRRQRARRLDANDLRGHTEPAGRAQLGRMAVARRDDTQKEHRQRWQSSRKRALV